MSEDNKQIFRRYSPNRNKHPLTHVFLGGLALAGGAVPSVQYGQWLAASYGGLIADWLDIATMASPAPLAVAFTIICTPSRSWRDTALACFAGIIAGCQFMAGMTLGVLLVSHTFPIGPPHIWAKLIPGFVGAAMAAPVMFGVLALMNRRIDQQISAGPATGKGNSRTGP